MGLSASTVPEKVILLFRIAPSVGEINSITGGATISMTSGLVQIFSNDYLPLRIGRNLGLLSLDRLPVLKRPLVRRSLGLIARQNKRKSWK